MRKILHTLLVALLIIIATLIIRTKSLGVEYMASGQFTYRKTSETTISIVRYIIGEGQTSITIPSFIDDYEVTSIDYDAFDCDSINELIINDNILKLASNSFKNCQDVVFLTLPSHIVNGDGFESLDNLSKLSITYGFNGFMDDGYNSDSLFWSNSKDSIRSIYIDDGVRYIGSNTFSNMAQLESIVLPSSIESIGDYAFYNSNNIKSIKLSENLKSLGINSLYFDNETQSQSIVEIPQSIEFLGIDCFKDGFNYFVYKNSKSENYFTNNNISFTEIDLSFENDVYDINLGDIAYLALNNADVLDGNISFKSSDESVVTIDQNGKVTTHSTGKAQIFAFASAGKSSCIVNVNTDENLENSKYKLMNLYGEYQIIPYEEFNIFTNHTYNNYIYTSNNPEVVEISEEGIIYANSEGKAIISIQDDTGLKSNYIINVSNLVTKINVPNSIISLHRGNGANIGASVSPSNANNRQLTYSSSDEKIVSVDSRGNIYGRANGSAIITISATDGSNTTREVTVNVSSTTIYCDNAPAILMPGKHYKLRCSSDDGSKVYYYSDDEKIATVDANGIVYANKVGECNIVAYNESQSAYRTIKVNVLDGFSYGVDLSEWNGRYYDDSHFVKLKNDGIDFVYLRAAYGDDYKDPIFERNYKYAKMAGLDVAPYHYIISMNAQEAASEAYHMLWCIQGKKFEYPIMVDIEEPAQKGLSNYEWNEIVNTYCSILENNGYSTILYSYASMLNKNDGSQEIWVAQWGSTTPSVYRRGNHTIWQFTDKGKVDGINGWVDMDICLFDYPKYIKENHKNGY